MAKYANGTRVPVSTSVGEIEKLMGRFGVDLEHDFEQVKRGGQYQCYWRLDGVTFTASVDTRDAPDEAEVRRMWRVMVHHIKNQLMVVEEGWLDAKLALAPFLMLPDGTMGKDHLAKQISSDVGMPQLTIGKAEVGS